MRDGNGFIPKRPFSLMILFMAMAIGSDGDILGLPTTMMLVEITATASEVLSMCNDPCFSLV
ncbi:hypothetical protein TIFTF001_053199 [Ficus carica]|uniref:Uncharacterized protein n=1 Tax=Ficus carica TaxID=3494 RepID=A0AA88EHD3_FICCA|nr:hypothetical protein TIFTF001_053193 [Ficus carica]GMN74672.1 hypothetical protein TIFTF001_053195 [Ficus carica]GMN74678.1 hypothetical protein TIFTF001_053197 [Ficus carica]GMN74684.1 hypothetical protein TIFTF001_053199 [Ficus carica]